MTDEPRGSSSLLRRTTSEPSRAPQPARETENDLPSSADTRLTGGTVSRTDALDAVLVGLCDWHPDEELARRLAAAASEADLERRRDLVALRDRVAELEAERDRAVADSIRLGDALFDLVETKDENVRLRADLKRSRALPPDLEELVASTRDLAESMREGLEGVKRGALDAFAGSFDELANVVEELGKRNEELAVRQDERACGWFVVDPDEGICGAYETEAEAEAARLAMLEPDEIEGSETYVAEVDFVGPLRKRIAELEAQDRELSEKFRAERARRERLESERISVAIGARKVAGDLNSWASVLADGFRKTLPVVALALLASPPPADAGEPLERTPWRIRFCSSVSTYCALEPIDTPPTVEEACAVLPALRCDLVETFESTTGEVWPCECVGRGLIRIPPAEPVPGPFPVEASR